MGGLGQCVTCQIFEFLFFLFFFFFCFLHHAPRSHFLTDRNDLYAVMRVSGQGCAFWGSRQYPTTFRGSNPKKTSPKWAGIGTSQPNRRSSKNSHISVTDEDIRVKFHTDIDFWGPLSKNAKLGQRGSQRGHVTDF